MWGWFIGIFVGVWLLQLLLTSMQLKHYRKTIKDMSNRSSGYLGTGVIKQRFGIGVVVILVSDAAGTIIDGKVMSGVTVFSRFNPLTKYNGMSVNECKAKLQNDLPDHAVEIAIVKILGQMEKTQSIG